MAATPKISIAHIYSPNLLSYTQFKALKDDEGSNVFITKSSLSYENMIKEFDPDVLCMEGIDETNTAFLEKISSYGYKVYVIPKKEVSLKITYNSIGILIAIKSDKFECISKHICIYKLLFENHEVFGLIMEIKDKNDNTSFIIGSVYLTPEFKKWSRNDIKQRIEKEMKSIHDTIHDIGKPDVPVLITGNFNDTQNGYAFKSMSNNGYDKSSFTVDDDKQNHIWYRSIFPQTTFGDGDTADLYCAF